MANNQAYEDMVLYHGARTYWPFDEQSVAGAKAVDAIAKGPLAYGYGDNGMNSTSWPIRHGTSNLTAAEAACVNGPALMPAFPLHLSRSMCRDTASGGSNGAMGILYVPYGVDTLPRGWRHDSDWSLEFWYRPRWLQSNPPSGNGNRRNVQYLLHGGTYYSNSVNYTSTHLYVSLASSSTSLKPRMDIRGYYYGAETTSVWQAVTDSTSRVYTDGTTYHIVFTLDQTALSLYVDGELTGQTLFPQPFIPNYPSSIRMCIEDNGTDRSVLGYLSDIAYYPRALPSTLVRDHYLLGTYGYSSIKVRGTVTEPGTGPVQRLVRAYDRKSGELIGSAYSDPGTGVFTIHPVGGSAHGLMYCVAFDDNNAPDYNAVIADRVVGIGGDAA